jgi:hypothetical protein
MDTEAKRILKAIRDWHDFNWRDHSELNLTKPEIRELEKQDQRNLPCPIFVDVDDTLIFWREQRLTASMTLKVPFHPDWEPNWELIRFLRLLKRLCAVDITIWSAGGKAHADDVVDKLNIRGIVKDVIAKPAVTIDDTQIWTIFSTNFDPKVRDKRKS